MVTLKNDLWSITNRYFTCKKDFGSIGTLEIRLFYHSRGIYVHNIKKNKLLVNNI